MFSLAKFQRPTFELEIKEGIVIHIYPPAKEMADKLTAVESMKGKELENEVYKVLAELISNNRENYSVTSDDMRIYAEDALIALLQTFLDFVRGIYKDPN